MSKLPKKLWMAIFGLFFLCLFGAGTAVVLTLLAPNEADYPHGTIITGTERCGEREWLQRGRSVRLERYRCIVTTDARNDIIRWYIDRGYAPRNGGYVTSRYSDGWIPISEVERVYLIDRKDGTTMVRIYDDTTVRAP